jgi:hypothetical protein
MASGKTVCSNYLVENHNYNKISLAEPIYWIVNNLNKESSINLYYHYLDPYINPPLTYDNQIKIINLIEKIKKIPNEKPKPRKRLQWFGTDGIRKQICDTMWIDILLNRISKNPEKKYVVDDVRFPNELEILKKNNFIIVKLEVDSHIQRERLQHLYGKFDESILYHDSEKDIEKLKGDITINANTPLKIMFQDLKKGLKGVI